MTKVVIACAGPRTIFGGPRHMLPVHGEPLLHRTVRQLQADAHLFEEIRIVVPKGQEKDHVVPGATTYGVIPGDNEYYSTRKQWNQDGRTILLLGDVVWDTRDLRKVIYSDRNSYTVFGRQNGSALTKTPWGEIFAVLFHSNDIDLLQRRLDKNRELRDLRAIPRAGGWELLRSMMGVPVVYPGRPGFNPVNESLFVEVVDEKSTTDDLDFPIDYLNLKKVWKEV